MLGVDDTAFLLVREVFRSWEIYSIFRQWTATAYTGTGRVSMVRACQYLQHFPAIECLASRLGHHLLPSARHAFLCSEFCESCEGPIRPAICYILRQASYDAAGCKLPRAYQRSPRLESVMIHELFVISRLFCERVCILRRI